MKWFSLGGKRYVFFVLFLLLLVAGVVVWVERDALLLWYYSSKLRNAETPEETQKWAKRLASYKQKAIPSVIECLKCPCPRMTANGQCALCCLLEHRGEQDYQCADTLEHIIKQFPQLSPQGRQKIMESALIWTETLPESPTAFHQTLSKLLTEVIHHPNEPLLDQGIILAQRLLKLDADNETLSVIGREITLLGLRGQKEETRLRSIELALLPSMKLRRDVLPLLHDESAKVRLQALRAVAYPREGQPELILTDKLIRWLHDDDFEVRRVCESVLLRRGLTTKQIHLARQITSSDWQVRLQVVEHLPAHASLDRSVWLRRLSHDRSPAVRVAAMRTACEMDEVNLVDRIDEMAQNDPDETVRIQAKYFLRLCREQVQKKH